MKKHIIIPSLILVNFFLAEAGLIQISGTVTDQSNKPVKDALVKLVKKNITDTTDENGKFHIIYDPSVVVSNAAVKNTTLPFTVIRNTIQLNLRSNETVKITLFDLSGRLVQSIYKGTLKAGTSLFSMKHLPDLGIIRCTIGKNLYTCKVMNGLPLLNTAAMENANGIQYSNTKKSAAVDNDSTMDMLEIRYPSYTMLKYLLNPYRNSAITVSICQTGANWITELDSMYIDQEVLATALDNGNYMAMGQIHSPQGDYNLSFFTLDQTGSVLTKNVYGTFDNDLEHELFLQNDHNVRIFGEMWYTQSEIHYDLMTICVSPSGDPLSNRVFVTNDEIMGGHGAITNDGGYVIAGYKSSNNGSDCAPTVTKVASDGSVSWEKEYAWPHKYSLNSEIISLADGGFVLSGYSYDESAQGYVMWLLKIDENGAIKDSTILKDKDRPWVRQVCETTDKKLFLLGENDVNDITYSYLARLSADCSLEWDTTILDHSKSYECMLPLKDGSILIAYNQTIKQGTTGMPDQEEIGILQTKTDGTVIKELDPIKNAGHPKSIAIGKDNSIIIASEKGYTLSSQKFFISNIANEFESE